LVHASAPGTRAQHACAGCHPTTPTPPQELGGDFDWCGSWRETYLQHTAAPRYTPHSHRPLRVAGLYSDLLHQPWLCATVELQPAWLEVDNIDR
jgi:hypothetical protein